ncbi:MAG TPA: SIMPL domain-containing protein [Actinomycetota bacterium]|nr:SIMPL domain-containing protein [Actinomycetota bacterium]
MGQPDATIRIQGQGSAPAVPDGIRFRLTLSATRPRPDEALHDVTTRSERLDALLTELGISDDARSTSGLSIREQREWVTETTDGAHRERSVHRGFEAQNSILVRIDDPAISGRLIQGAVEEADALVDGPWWHVAAENPGHLEACAEAARDARRRAEAYAEALGLRLGAVRSIKDSVATPWEQPRGMLAAAGPSTAEGIGIDANLELSATVTITYDIEG